VYKVFSEKKIHAVERLYDRYNAWATGIAGLTPIPYKVFTIAGGAFKINFKVFVLASIVSRTLRFMTEGVLLFFYGEAIRVFIFKWFNWLSIAFVVLLVGGFWLVHRYGKHAHREAQVAEDAPES
jgi:membrane protein DedA with SNARE-associated domain